MIKHLDEGLRAYALSDEQWSKYVALCTYGSCNKAAKETQFSASAISRAERAIKRNASRQGYAPEHGWNNPVPEGYHIRGKSVLRDLRTGEAVMEWEKTDRDRDSEMQVIRLAVDAMCGDLPKVKPRSNMPSLSNDEIMSIIPMGDPHFGMYSWSDETGEDFDLDIAKHDMCAAVDHLVKQSPTTGRCVIVNLGDFFHVDNLKNATSQSGNILDVDSRLGKMISVGMSAMRQAVESALDCHQEVEVVNAIGNHDGALTPALSLMLHNLYEREPRVTIRMEPTPRHYLTHGKVLIGITHGDRTKDRDLPGIMAAEVAEMWGASTHRYFYRGHHHHDSLEMFNGCTVEQFSTLAPNDAWHNAGGYLTGRNMKLIAHHKEYGEVARSVCSIDMLRGMK